jgi:hypothetical protein
MPFLLPELRFNLLNAIFELRVDGKLGAFFSAAYPYRLSLQLVLLLCSLVQALIVAIATKQAALRKNG